MRTASATDHPPTPAGWDRRRHSLLSTGRLDVIADPGPFYRAVAELPPVYWDETSKVWVCRGYAEVSAVLRDHNRFRSGRRHTSEALDARGMGDVAQVQQLLDQQLLFLDPPDHTTARDALRTAFTPAATASREPAVAGIVRDLLQRLPGHGQVDVLADFAGPLPTLLNAVRLGLTDRIDELGAWADAYGALLGSVGSLPRIQDRRVVPVLEEARESLRGLVAERRGGDGEDLISVVARALAPADLRGEQLDQRLDCAAANLLVVAAGGYETLSQLIAGGLVLLSRHPGQLARLRAEPELISSAISEVMRLDGSSQFVARVAAEDVVVGGQHIAAGSSVVALLAAANRDPAQFPTDPDGFDIGRAQGRHLGFAAGRHHCIGSVDAEQAARLALTAFIDRYPTFELAPGKAVTWGTHANTRCPTRVLMRVAGRDGCRRDATVSAMVAEPAGPAPRSAPAPRSRRVELTDRDVAELRAVAVPPTSLSAELLWPAAVAAVAERAPASVALRAGETTTGGTTTYERLVRTADVLAERLRHLGVEPGVVVGVLTDRSPESYIAALAAGRAGAAFLAADSTCPQERLREMLRQSRTAVLCIQRHLLDLARSVAPAGVELVVVDGDELAAAPVPPPVVSGVNPGDPAYVVFTSGSSGHPKPIVITHLALLNLQVALRQVYRVTPDDRVLQWFSPHFDGWPFDLVTALTAGAQLVLAPTAGRCVGPALRDTLREHGVTVATLTPTAWRSCPDPGTLPALRLAASAGEPLRAGLVGELAAPGRRILNLYGPAEAAIWSTWHECHPADGDPPIGVPIPNRRLYLLTAAGRPAPHGVVGELWIGGAGVGRYLGQPELMQAGFAPDPLAGAPGELMYATGDLCRRRSDGSMDYIGRADRQIKLRGQRIEPEEIERALEAVPGVQNAVVELVEGRLIARVVPVPGADLDPAALTEHLRARVHSAMVPVIHVGGRTGMSLTGKRLVVAVDHGGGRAEARADSRDRTRHVHDPRPGRGSSRRHTVLTWSIARLIASQLQIPQAEIRAGTDFFTLGGDSLSLSELLVAIEDGFGVVLALDDVLAEPSPVQLARLVQVAETPA